MPSDDLNERYLSAMHAMQSAVAHEIATVGEAASGASAKHLRAGLNGALADTGSLATLLIAKGIITLEEYSQAITEGAEREAERAAQIARQRCGLPDTVTFA